MIVLLQEVFKNILDVPNKRNRRSYIFSNLSRIHIYMHHYLIFRNKVRSVYCSVGNPCPNHQKKIRFIHGSVDELLWSGGMTTLNQIMSRRGLEVVSAENIAATASNLFFCAFFAMGTAISIIVGQLLGAGKLEQAVDEDRT